MSNIEYDLIRTSTIDAGVQLDIYESLEIYVDDSNDKVNVTIYKGIIDNNPYLYISMKNILSIMEMSDTLAMPNSFSRHGYTFPNVINTDDRKNGDGVYMTIPELLIQIHKWRISDTKRKHPMFEELKYVQRSFDDNKQETIKQDCSSFAKETLNEASKEIVNNECSIESQMLDIATKIKDLYEENNELKEQLATIKDKSAQDGKFTKNDLKIYHNVLTFKSLEQFDMIYSQHMYNAVFGVTKGYFDNAVASSNADNVYKLANYKMCQYINDTFNTGSSIWSDYQFSIRFNTDQASDKPNMKILKMLFMNKFGFFVIREMFFKKICFGNSAFKQETRETNLEIFIHNLAGKLECSTTIAKLLINKYMYCGLVKYEENIINLSEAEKVFLQDIRLKGILKTSIFDVMF